MSDTHGDEPRLGEPTPALQHPTKGPWYTTRLFVAAAALVVGAALGTVGASFLNDDGVDELAAPSEATTTTTTTTPPTTTTTAAPTLPEVCIDTLEVSQQGLQLVNQALASLRRGDFAELDRVLGDLERLRGDFAGRVRECRDRLQP